MYYAFTGFYAFARLQYLSICGKKLLCMEVCGLENPAIQALRSTKTKIFTTKINCRKTLKMINGTS
jgi:hypothetical protein